MPCENVRAFDLFLGGLGRSRGVEPRGRGHETGFFRGEECRVGERELCEGTDKGAV